MNTPMELSPDAISTILSKKKIKPSLQRIVVYDYLNNYRTHPNVDKIYQDLLGIYPSLSRTTVYNTLKLFINKKLVTPILIEENEMRYDIDCSAHSHFKCNKCGNIYDLPLAVNHPVPNNFEVTEAHYYFKGICSSCK